MFKAFEIVMTVILAYMAYVLYLGTASPVVLGLLLAVQAMFWALDFSLIRPGEDGLTRSLGSLELTSSLSHG